MKGDAYRLRRIVEMGTKLLGKVQEKGITRASLLESEDAQWYVTTPLYDIGEQAYCISQEVRQDHPEVPWSQVAGLRHRLVHDYSETNWNMVAAVVFDELELLVEQAAAILQELDPQ